MKTIISSIIIAITVSFAALIGTGPAAALPIAAPVELTQNKGVVKVQYLQFSIGPGYRGGYRRPYYAPRRYYRRPYYAPRYAPRRAYRRPYYAPRRYYAPRPYYNAQPRRYNRRRSSGHTHWHRHSRGGSHSHRHWGSHHH